MKTVERRQKEITSSIGALARRNHGDLKPRKDVAC